jgi:hypothetical protein
VVLQLGRRHDRQRQVSRDDLPSVIRAARHCNQRITEGPPQGGLSLCMTRHVTYCLSAAAIDEAKETEK